MKKILHYKKIIYYLIPVLLILLYLFKEPFYTPTAIHSLANHSHFPKYIARISKVSDLMQTDIVSSIQKSLESKIDALEFDIALSKDGVLFSYSNDFSQVNECNLDFEACNWSEIQNYSKEFPTKFKTLSLEDVLKISGSQKHIFLDVKTKSIGGKDLPAKLVKLIKDHHMEDSVIVESFDPLFLTKMRLKARDILLMYDFVVGNVQNDEEPQCKSLPWILKSTFVQKQIRRIVRPDILGPKWQIPPKYIKFFSKKGYPLICWTVDDPLLAKNLMKYGVRGVQTNVPFELIKFDYQSSSHILDAGGSRCKADKIVHVREFKDALYAIQEAKKYNKSITIGGAKHSMGGQTLLDGSIHLDMRRLNKVAYDPLNLTVKAQSGATWKKIQSVLNCHQRSVKIMQSDNIFTVGGSVSVNVHGWQVNCPPLVSTIKSITLMLDSGKIVKINKENNPELFSSVVGGYGQFGIILEAEFITVPNSQLKFNCNFVKLDDFPTTYLEKISNNSNIELAYGRLSLDKKNLCDEVGLFWYEKEQNTKSSNIDIESEKLVFWKRIIFRASQYFDIAKKFRWAIEKFYSKKLAKSKVLISRNTAMNTDVHVLWNNSDTTRDILQEYFIPKNEVVDFVRNLKRLVKKYDMNLMNVTIREIKKDDISLLAYAKDDVMSFVLSFSRKEHEHDRQSMKKFTVDLVDEALKAQGSFYLPYCLDYEKLQVTKAYKNLEKWIKLRKLYNPNGTFDSVFFQYVDS